MKLPSTIDTLIFDLDNTLIDRNTAMKLSVHAWLKNQQTIDENKIETETNNILLQDHSGYNNRTSFCNWLIEHYGNEETKNTKSAHDVLKEIQKMMITFIQPNQEINNSLKQLQQQYLLVLASNGSNHIQQKKIKKANLNSIFSAKHIYISEAIGYSKPDVRFFNHILLSIDKKPKQCLMIGDDFLNDIKGAKTYGIYTCWIKNGVQQSDHSADIILNQTIDINQWLKA